LKKLIKKIGLPALLIIAVCAVVVAAHWPALSAKAVSFDDQQYVSRNILIQNPGWHSAKRFLAEIFTPSTVSGYYQPLTMISLMLDYAAGGREDNLLPFHLTSLALHAANTALVIVLLYMLFGNIWVAAALGLLFGVHPLTVETIPWLSERKTLLASFFAFWSLIYYVRFARTNRPDWFVACGFAYLFALMSKPTSLFLPFVMLLMDYWPLKRFNLKAVREKLPLFVLLLVFLFITLVSQLRTGGGTFPGQGTHRLLNAPLIICYDIVFYLFKIVWPANLSSHYPYPQPFGLSNPKVLAGVLGTAVLVVLLIFSRRRTPAAIIGSLIFFVTILPTMQIFKFSEVIASDKFLYLPAIGLLMILTSFVLWLTVGRRWRAIAVAIIVLLLAGAEFVATRRYLPYWADTFTLYEHMLTIAPNSAPLHGILASAYGRLGQHEKAIEILKHAQTLDPNNPDVYFNFGVAYLRLGKARQAVEVLQKAIALRPYYADAYTNLAVAYGFLGKFEEEIEACRQAIGYKPESVEAWATLGSAYGNLGRIPEAVQAYEYAVRINPKDAQARFGLVYAYLQSGDKESALKEYQVLKQLNPQLASGLRPLIEK